MYTFPTLTATQSSLSMGIPLRVSQVLRLVLDPDMLQQLARKTAESLMTSSKPTARARRDKKSKSEGATVVRTPPFSHVDAWKSINDRPFCPWIDPSLDLWDSRFGADGPAAEDWLETPPSSEELDKAVSTMEVCADRTCALCVVCMSPVLT